MKPSIHILLATLVCMTACKTVKQTTHEERVSDSTKTDRVEYVSDTVTVIKERLVKDTIIKYERKLVRDTITLADLETPTTKDGKILARRHEKKVDGVRPFIEVQPNGQIVYGCDVDELMIRVNNLVSEKSFYKHQRDSIATLLKERNHKTVSVTEKHTKKKSNPVWLIVLIVIVCAILFVVFHFIIKFLKR